MTRADIRAAVDHAIRRHLETRGSVPPAAPRAAARAAVGVVSGPAVSAPAAVSPQHPSQVRFPVPDGAASGGRCVIEPGAACVLSGHCQAQGY